MAAKRLTYYNCPASCEFANPHRSIVDEGLPRKIDRPSLALAMASLVRGENAVGRAQP